MSTAIAHAVAEVPERFEHSERSTGCLLKELGFPEARAALHVDDMLEALQAQPELMDHWLDRGSDQRLAGGWGLECEGDLYRVHNFSSGESLLFPDRVRACAEFIVRYVRLIGDVQARA